MLLLLMLFSIKSANGAATLAQRSRCRCEPVHCRNPNRTFGDGHHNGERALARDVSRSIMAITRSRWTRRQPPDAVQFPEIRLVRLRASVCPRVISCPASLVGLRLGQSEPPHISGSGAILMRVMRSESRDASIPEVLLNANWFLFALFALTLGWNR
jgi:hypothetical protein